MKAVVVDDARIIRQHIIDALRELSSLDKIAQAIDGLDALRVIREMQPNLVVLDIHMPSADGKRVDNGIDVLKVIKAEPNPPAVIMLSNFADPKYREWCKKLGADAFLDKSHEFFHLLPIAEALLNERRTRQDILLQNNSC